MPNRTAVKPKNDVLPQYGVQREVRRDLRAWKNLYGVWRGKKIPNPIRWQEKIRKELERQLP